MKLSEIKALAESIEGTYAANGPMKDLAEQTLLLIELVYSVNIDMENNGEMTRDQFRNDLAEVGYFEID